MIRIDTSLEAYRGATPQLRDRPVANDHSLDGSEQAGGVMATGSSGHFPIRDCCCDFKVLLTSLRSLAMAWFNAHRSSSMNVSGVVASSKPPRAASRWFSPVVRQTFAMLLRVVVLSAKLIYLCLQAVFAFISCMLLFGHALVKRGVDLA